MRGIRYMNNRNEMRKLMEAASGRHNEAWYRTFEDGSIEFAIIIHTDIPVEDFNCKIVKIMLSATEYKLEPGERTIPGAFTVYLDRAIKIDDDYFDDDDEIDDYDLDEIISDHLTYLSLGELPIEWRAIIEELGVSDVGQAQVDTEAMYSWRALRKAIKQGLLPEKKNGSVSDYW